MIKFILILLFTLSANSAPPPCSGADVSCEQINCSQEFRKLVRRYIELGAMAQSQFMQSLQTRIILNGMTKI